MARIPDGDLERLNGQVSLVRLIEASGTHLIRQGIVILLSIPVVLVALGTSGGIVDFKLNEWLLVGLAEIPIACGLLGVVNLVCKKIGGSTFMPQNQSPKNSE